MKNSYLLIKVKNYPYEKIIQKFQMINIDIFDVNIKNNDVYIKIFQKDFSKIKKYLPFVEVEKIKYTGLANLKANFKRYKITIITFLFAVLFVFLCSNVIVDINIIHEDNDLVELIDYELNEYGIKKFSFKKSYYYLEKVKEKIKNKYLDKIDWLEIQNVGMKYIVRVEERIVTPKENDREYCNIYASKDGLIKKIKVYTGETVKNINDYVKKGDLIIRGDILLNEEVVNYECATGNVYAEVWYKINLQIPLKRDKKIRTGKVRNNFIVNYNGVDYQLLKNRIKNYESEKKLIFDLLGIKIYQKKEYEIAKKQVIYNESQAIEEAINLAKEKIKQKIGKNDKIIKQKILQKSLIDSKMNIDIFIVTQEDISKQIEQRKGVEHDL